MIFNNIFPPCTAPGDAVIYAFQKQMEDFSRRNEAV